MGSRAITTPHHLTTVQLTRVAGGGRFYAVCALAARVGLPSRPRSLEEPQIVGKSNGKMPAWLALKRPSLMFDSVSLTRRRALHKQVLCS